MSATGKDSVTGIQAYLGKKFSSFTKEGKDRKARLADKFFKIRIETLSILHMFVSVLPSLKKYVLFFQQKEPVMHLLHEKQHELFHDFCSSFLTPECLQKRPHEVDIEDEANQKPVRAMFVPQKAADLLKTREGLSHRKDLTHKLRKAYVACALTLQKKMPVNNCALKGCAALDPSVRRTSSAQQYLKSLVKTSLVDKADEEG